MSDARPREEAGPSGSDEQVLLIVVSSDPSTMDDVITVLLDIGVPGATLVEGKGLAAVLRDEMPIFAGLVALLPETTGSRLLFSATPKRLAGAFFDFIEREMPAKQRPLALALPVERMTGLGS